MSSLNVSRLEEKEQLAHLNDRLAKYIDFVQDLKADKLRLTEELLVLRTSKTSNAEDAKALYEDEIQTIRRALDQEAREKAEAHLEIGRLKEQLQERRDLERKNKALQKANDALEQEALDAASRLETAEALARRETKEAKSLRSQAAKLRRELDDLKAALADLQKSLEAEQMQGVSLENTNQSLREELTFKERVWNTTFSEKETLEKTVRTQEEIEETFRLRYAQRLHDALAELRGNYEELMISFTNALGNTRKVSRPNLNISLSNDAESALVSDLNSRIEELRISYDRSSLDLKEERSRVASLNRRIASLESAQSALKRSHVAEKEELLSQMSSLQDDYDALQTEFEELTLAKIRLDQEIEQYRILLQGEEVRLGLPATPSPGRATNKRKKSRDDHIEEATGAELSATIKRQRLNDSFTANASEICAETTTDGDVHIDELNLDGYYVKLTNTTQSDIKLDGFSLLTRKDDDAEAIYNFPKRFVLPAEGNVCIWAESGKQFKRQGDLLWKKQDAFFSSVGSEMALYDNKGEVVSYTVLSRADAEQEIFDSGTEQEERRASCSVM